MSLKFKGLIPYLDERVVLLERQVKREGSGLAVDWLELGEVWASLRPCAYPRRPPVPGSSGLGCVAYEVIMRQDAKILRAQRLSWQGQNLDVYHTAHKGPAGFVVLRALAWVEAWAN
jgi:head-tail adaptor